MKPFECWLGRAKCGQVPLIRLKQNPNRESPAGCYGGAARPRLYALPLEANDPGGKLHMLDDYKGKVLILDFWGTWCLPCRKSMPILEKLHRSYKAKGLVVIGISVADKEADLRSS